MSRPGLKARHNRLARTFGGQTMGTADVLFGAMALGGDREGLTRSSTRDETPEVRRNRARRLGIGGALLSADGQKLTSKLPQKERSFRKILLPAASRSNRPTNSSATPVVALLPSCPGLMSQAGVGTVFETRSGRVQTGKCNDWNSARHASLKLRSGSINPLCAMSRSCGKVLFGS